MYTLYMYSMERRVKSGCLTSLEDTVLYWRIQNQYEKSDLQHNALNMEDQILKSSAADKQHFEGDPKSSTGALIFGPPTCSPSDSSTHMVGLSSWWQFGHLNFSTHTFLVPVSFSTQIFRPPLGEGELIVTCDSWSNLLWQLVHPLWEVKLGPIVTRSLVADDSHFFQPILLKLARPCK
jgi:hypothetical protein